MFIQYCCNCHYYKYILKIVRLIGIGFFCPPNNWYRYRRWKIIIGRPLLRTVIQCIVPSFHFSLCVITFLFLYFISLHWRGGPVSKQFTVSLHLLFYDGCDKYIWFYLCAWVRLTHTGGSVQLCSVCWGLLLAPQQLSEWTRGELYRITWLIKTTLERVILELLYLANLWK